MKAHTQTFKENLITLGKEINAKVIYTIDGVTTELGGDELGSVTPHYEGSILKSVMKQMDLISDVDIPLNTEINVQFGMKYDDDEFEYIDYGNYIVFSSEKQEDTNNYKIIAYDKMLYAMKDYEQLFETNLFDGQIEEGYINVNTGENVDGVNVRTADYIEIEPNTKYTISDDKQYKDTWGVFYNEDKEYISNLQLKSYQSNSGTFTTPGNAKYIRWYNATSTGTNPKWVLNLGEEVLQVYPVTINQYIEKLCNKIDLEFANSNEIYCNYDKEITQELYADLGYTYRDVLDQLAQVTASTICINKDDQLEIRYLNDSINESEEVEGQEFEITDNDSDVVKIQELEGQTTQDTTTGKNLIGTNYITYATINDSETNDFTFTGAWATTIVNNENLLKILQPSTTYTISFKFKAVSRPSSFGQYNHDNFFVIYKSGGSWIPIDNALKNTGTIGTWYSISKTFTTPSDLTDYTILAYDYKDTNNATQGSIEIKELQIEKGNSATTFEKFSYGVSPNPNYPQDIDIRTGNQVVDVRGNKNLLSKPFYQDTTNVVRTQINYMKPNTYTFSCVYGGSGVISQLTIRKIVGGVSSIVALNYNQSKITFTLDEQATLDISLYKAPILLSDVSNAQLEIGNQATDYVPFIGGQYQLNLGKNLLSVPFTQTSANTCKSEIPNFKKGGYIFSFELENVTGNQVSARKIVNGVTTQIKAVYNAKSIFFTLDEDATLQLEVYRSGLQLSELSNLQLEKGSIQTSYSPYFEPIELGEISNYKDLIFKGKGTNLFNDTLRQGVTMYNTGEWGASNSRITSTDWTILPAGTYTISANTSANKSLGVSNITFDLEGNFLNITGLSGVWKTMPCTFTIEQPIKWKCNIRFTDDTNLTPSQVLNVMIQSGNQTTTYEPYNAKGKWYLHKEIGKVTITTNSNITHYNGLHWVGFNKPTDSIMYQNFIRYELKMERAYYSNSNNDTYSYQTSLGSGGMGIMCTSTDTIEALKPLIDGSLMYYPLKTPTTTEITKDNYPELLSQLKALEKMKLLDGYTKITSDIPIKFSYATDYETINEDYIKNTRASFGEKYGPINSIVLSRSADSDNIYLRDEDSIEENGLCEVKIKDNQIMNDNNRSEFLPDLLEYLKGIEYYINDFESIGITYLDLLDRYKVVIGDKSYYCVMFNDEVDIHDGLNEIIYTEKPKEEVPDYKKATNEEKKDRQTYLMVDKQAQRIDALVSDEEENFSRIQVEIDNISSQVQSTNVELDNLGNEINVVRSSISEQTSEAITDWFNTALKPTIEDLENSVDSNDQTLNEIKSYVRRGVITDPQSPYYNQAFVELGDTTNQTTLRILPNRIQFLTNGQETAFISNNQLYINESTILTKEKIGNWVTTQDEDGLLNTYWED